MWQKIKNRLRRISILGLLLVIAAFPLTYYLALGALRLTVRPTVPMPFARPDTVAQGAAIQSGQDVVTVAEAGDYVMSLDTNTLNIAITHIPSGRIFNTLVTDPAMPIAARSPLIIRFLGEDSMLYEWDAYSYAIADKNFSLYQIENGVQFVLYFQETDSTRLLEYIPSRITIERFHEAFVDKITVREEAGYITSDDAAQFRRALNLVYQRDDAEGVYFYMLGGLPPAGLVTILVEMTRALDYTRDILIDDLAELGILMAFVEPAAFTITVNHTLTSAGEFIVDIPVIEHANNNPFFTLQNILVYPAFDATFAEENTGFIFVPDGAGKLIALDSFDIRRSNFNRPVFNNTLFDMDNYFFRSGIEEDLHMPVFGMWNTNDRGVNSGFFTIIESGAQTAHIATTLRASGGGAGPMYNAVFASIDTMQFSRVRIFGPLSPEQARFLATTGDLNPHITLRYILYPEGAGYFEFAQEYRRFLIDRYGFEVSYDNRPRIFIEFVGAVTSLRNFLGIAYAHNIPMTTYNQAAYILGDLRGQNINVVANFKHGLNGGRYGTVGNRANHVRSLGSRRDLDALLSMSAPGSEVFIEANLMRFHRVNRRFDARRFHLSDFGTAYGVQLADGWHPRGTQMGMNMWSHYRFIHPLYLPFVVDGFMRDAAGRFENVTLTDFGTIPYANYDPRNIVSPYDAQFGILHPILEKMASEMNLALDNPNADRLRFATYALNISRQSSETGVFYTSIPFRQLVLNGLVQFTTLNVNGAIMPKEYFLLQALEVGAIPKFTVFYESTSTLLSAFISCYFSHEYRRLRNDILWLANAYEEAFALIGIKEISHHKTLAPGVFVTTYANGVRVYVNYNLFPVSGEGFELDALGFKIQGGAI